MKSTSKRIVLGVTGSIAAYKAVYLLRQLQAEGHDVTVVQTPAGRRFVGEMTFQALSGNPVLGEQFSAPAQSGQESVFSHIELAGSDLLLIAPATASTIGKMAAGIADNLLLDVYLAARCPVVVCPAMNSGMWDHPAVRANLETLKERGVLVVSPGKGELACGDEGEGRLAAPEEIMAAVNNVLGTEASGDLAGKRVLVTAGATREPIDSVRFITNRSSGAMGFALAEAARERGAQVTVIAANCFLERDPGIRYIDVCTTEEMAEAVNQEYQSSDMLIMAAAVADYKVSTGRTTGKLEREGKISLQLVPTGDIVSNLKAGTNGRLKVGFSAEFGVENLVRARSKLNEKNLDMIVFNDISRDDIGFDSVDNEIVIITPGKEDVTVGKTSKLNCADRILDEIKELMD